MSRREDGRGGRPVTVGSALSSWLKEAGLGARLEQVQALDRWRGAVGPQIAAVTRPETVNAQGTLWVRVTTSAWANELSLMSPRILSQLNRGVPPKAQVREIRWLVGPANSE